MARPTTRVLAVLDLLQSHGRLAGPELAQRVGVDVRTLRRYIVVLEELGIPITSERGRYGAYLLVPGFHLPPMMFTNDEAVALSIGMVAARGLGLADAAPAVESVQSKLARVMPEGLKRQAKAIAYTVKVDLRTAADAPGSNTALIVLTAAAQAQQRVHLHYRPGTGEDSEREFDPYGLAFFGGAWYALGWCRLRRDLRSFRLDRVSSVVALPKSFLRPRGFDALARLRESIATIPRRHTIEVTLKADLAAARRVFPAEFGLIEPHADGVLLRTSADDLTWFARQLAGLPFPFSVQAPAQLRNEVRALAARLRAQASNSSAWAASSSRSTNPPTPTPTRR